MPVTATILQETTESIQTINIHESIHFHLCDIEITYEKVNLKIVESKLYAHLLLVRKILITREANVNLLRLNK